MAVWSHCTDHLWDSPGGRAWAFWWQRRRCHRWKCWALCRSTCAMGGGPQTSVCSWWTVEASSWWSLKHTTTLQFAADERCRYHLKHTNSLALSSWGVMMKAETTNPQNVGSHDGKVWNTQSCWTLSDLLQISCSITRKKEYNTSLHEAGKIQTKYTEKMASVMLCWMEIALLAFYESSTQVPVNFNRSPACKLLPCMWVVTLVRELLTLACELLTLHSSC